MLNNILIERINLISDNCQVIRLILSEAPLLSTLGAESFMNRIIRMLRDVLVLAGVHTQMETFALRILMGSILSFVYLPRTGEEDVKAYAGQVASIVLGNMNSINREDD